MLEHSVTLPHSGRPLCFLWRICYSRQSGRSAPAPVRAANGGSGCHDVQSEHPWYSYGYAALLTLLSSGIVMVSTHYKLKRIDMIEALKSVE